MIKKITNKVQATALGAMCWLAAAINAQAGNEECKTYRVTLQISYPSRTPFQRFSRLYMCCSMNESIKIFRNFISERGAKIEGISVSYMAKDGGMGIKTIYPKRR